MAPDPRSVALSPFQHPGEAFAAVQLGLHVVCRPARHGDELALHHEIRRRVFVEEQAVFAVTDIDHHDDEPATVHVLGLCGDVAGGAVRLYPLIDPEAAAVEPGLWKGDRLSVLASFRRNGLGAPLVRFAVRTAALAGGRKMVAHIQPANVGFFRHLGWYPVGELVTFAGLPHQTMAIDLRPLTESTPSH